MNPDNLMKQLTAFGLVAMMLASLTAVSAQAVPIDRVIRILSSPGLNAASPEAEIWKKAPATLVTLQHDSPDHGGSAAITEQVIVQAVRAGGQLFVKLAWNDRSANTTIKDTTDYVDGAAIQFPVNGKASTPFMGDARKPVNVWHWRANGRTENLIAIGSGTATCVPSEGLHSTAVRTGNGWGVVFTRPLQVKQDEGVSLQGRGSIPVAFAVWDGNNHERDEAEEKMVEWWQLKF